MVVRIFIETYGCTFNQSDSDLISQMLKRNAQYFLVNSPESADIVIINSCSVKGSTEQKILHHMRSLKSKNIILCGCLPYINRREVRDLQNEGYKISIVGIRSMHKIIDVVEKLVKGSISAEFSEYKKEILREDLINQEKINQKNNNFQKLGSAIVRIPIAEGCTFSCSYCATKLARGELHSYPEEVIISWIKKAVDDGAREVQLTAQDVGGYGLDNKSSLSNLFDKISRINGDFRVRIGMANPAFVRRFLEDIFESNKFYRFLHLPVQSGSEKVLKDMKRGYKLKVIIDLISRLKKRYAQSGFTFATDIISGYPTENEEDYKKTIDFIKETKPDVINLSRFTKRPGTEASKLKSLPNNIIKRRTVELSKLCNAISLEVNKKYIGKREKVLLLEEGRDNTIKGRTQSYKQVVIQSKRLPESLIGKFADVKIISANSTSLFGSDLDFED